MQRPRRLTPSGQILTDTGPLVALVDARQRSHASCAATLRRLRLTMVTTWAAFAEAMYLLGREVGWPGQHLLWRFVMSEQLALSEPQDPARVAALMETYADVPMDLADATLVAVAEERGHRRVFTLDSDFYIYQLTNGRSFEVLPGL